MVIEKGGTRKEHLKRHSNTDVNATRHFNNHDLDRKVKKHERRLEETQKAHETNTQGDIATLLE
jgi:hypothetical protein